VLPPATGTIVKSSFPPGGGVEVAAASGFSLELSGLAATAALGTKQANKARQYDADRDVTIEWVKDAWASEKASAGGMQTPNLLQRPGSARVVLDDGLNALLDVRMVLDDGLNVLLSCPGGIG
jgi:hypothetical protein